MDRRQFLGRAMASGMTLMAASTLYASSARAEEPKRGGHLKLGIAGGASTDSLDPALASGSFEIGRAHV